MSGLCAICLGPRPKESLVMCERCGVAYDLHLKRSDETMASTIVWVANRVRTEQNARGRKP